MAFIVEDKMLTVFFCNDNLKGIVCVHLVRAYLLNKYVI